MELYAIKDKVAGEFFAPYASANDATAVRSARNSMRQVPTPEDFAVYHVCSMDAATGEVSVSVGLVCVCESLVPVPDAHTVIPGRGGKHE